MCRPTSRNGSPAAALIAGLAGLALATAAAAQTTVPDFSSNQAAWIATSNDFIPSAQGAKPVSFDPAYPYVPNLSLIHI